MSRKLILFFLILGLLQSIAKADDNKTRGVYPKMFFPRNAMQSFRTMDKLLPFRIVKKGKVASILKEKISPLSITYKFLGNDKAIDVFIKERNITGLLVIKGDTIRFEKYFHDSNRDTRFTSWSMAKSFIATAIFMALKEGKIKSLDDKAETYAAEYKGTDYGNTSIRALLAMSSGIKFSELYTNPRSDFRVLTASIFNSGKDPDKFLAGYKRNRPSFQDFHYVSSNTQILSAVLRGAYMMPVADIISEKIWQPLGMEADGYWSQNVKGSSGKAIGYCCLNATLRDYARFGLFYLQAHKGKGPGAKLLPKGWPQVLQKPATPRHASRGTFYGRGYSYQFWLPYDPDGEYMAAGAYGQYIWIDPKRDVVIVMTAVDPLSLPNRLQTDTLMKAIALSY